MVQAKQTRAKVKHSTSSKKVLVIVIIALVVIAIVAIVAVLLLTSKGSPGNSKMSASSTPTEVFLAYNGKMGNAGSFDEMVAIALEYGSEKTIGEFKSEEIEKIDNQQKQFIFSLVKMLFVTNDDINPNIAETINGNKATLTLNSKDGKQTGNAELVKENGIWKIDAVAWQQEEPSENI